MDVSSAALNRSDLRDVCSPLSLAHAQECLGRMTGNSELTLWDSERTMSSAVIEISRHCPRSKRSWFSESQMKHRMFDKSVTPSKVGGWTKDIFKTQRANTALILCRKSKHPVNSEL